MSKLTTFAGLEFYPHPTRRGRAVIADAANGYAKIEILVEDNVLLINVLSTDTNEHLKQVSLPYFDDTSMRDALETALIEKALPRADGYYSFIKEREARYAKLRNLLSDISNKPKSDD